MHLHFIIKICNIEIKEGVLILTAKREDGTMVILSSKMRKDELRGWRKTAQFYCPQCDGSVQLRVGEIVIPHFAHKKDATCTSSFSEGESKEHLEGKQHLYEFFQKRLTDVKLEPYLQTLAQRPDLLVNNVPIEFQCSTIPIHQVHSRTAGYIGVGMNPIWILHTPNKFKTIPQGVGIYQLSKFESFFISPQDSVFLTYYPQTKQFHYFSHLLHIVGRQYIGIHRKLSITSQIFPFARPKMPTEKEVAHYAALYLSMRKKFLNTRVLLNRKGINDSFLRQCYELKVIPLHLPLWIGIPVAMINPFPVHVVEWQLALLHLMKKRHFDLDDLTEPVLYHFVQKYAGSSAAQVESCLKFKDILFTLSVESVQDSVKFDEQELIQSLALLLLAK